MIESLIRRAEGLQLIAGEVLQVNQTADGELSPQCIITVRDFLQRWRGHSGIEYINRQLRSQAENLAFVGVIHGGGIALFGFVPQKVPA